MPCLLIMGLQVMSYSKRIRFVGCDYPSVLLRVEKYDAGAYRQFNWIGAQQRMNGVPHVR